MTFDLIDRVDFRGFQLTWVQNVVQNFTQTPLILKLADVYLSLERLASQSVLLVNLNLLFGVAD